MHLRDDLSTLALLRLVESLCQHPLTFTPRLNIVTQFVPPVDTDALPVGAKVLRKVLAHAEPTEIMSEGVAGDREAAEKRREQERADPRAAHRDPVGRDDDLHPLLRPQGRQDPPRAPRTD